MRVSNEVDQELEGFARDRIRKVTTLLDPFTEQIRRVSDGRKDVRALLTLPSLGTGEDTQLGRMVGDWVDVVQRRRPLHLVLDLVSPGRDRGEGARFGHP